MFVVAVAIVFKGMVISQFPVGAIAFLTVIGLPGCHANCAQQPTHSRSPGNRFSCI